MRETKEPLSAEPTMDPSDPSTYTDPQLTLQDKLVIKSLEDDLSNGQSPVIAHQARH